MNTIKKEQYNEHDDIALRCYDLLVRMKDLSLRINKFYESGEALDTELEFKLELERTRLLWEYEEIQKELLRSEKLEQQEKRA